MEKLTVDLKKELHGKAFKALFKQLLKDSKNISRETMLDSMLCLARILHHQEFDNVLTTFVEQLNV